MIDSVAGVTTIGARIAGHVGPGSAGPAEVTLYWGESDGGTDPDAWENESALALQEGGLFEIDLAGLQPGSQLLC